MAEYTLENTEGTIKNGQPRDTRTQGTKDGEKKNPQHNMFWTTLYANKHK